MFLQFGLQPFVPRLRHDEAEANVEPDGQMPLSGRSVQGGVVGQHGFTQYCVVPVQLVVPHGMVVVPLDPPELVVDPLDPPELVVVPELDVVPEELTPELVVVPELDEGRPLEDPLDDALVCVLLLV